jgi:hypothetical protein
MANGFGGDRRRAFLALGMALGLASFACGAGEPATSGPGGGEAEVVLARIGDEVVTLAELGAASPDPVRTTRRLEEVLQRRIASWEARRRGLDRQPKVTERIEQVRRDAELKVDGLLRDALYNDIRLGLTFGEEELRAHYETIKARFQEPQWTFRIQHFAHELEAREAAKRLGAKDPLDAARSRVLGPVPAALLPRKLMTRTREFREPGDRRLLDLDGTWSLVELVEYQPVVQLPFEKVRDRVQLELGAARARVLLTEELEKLRKEHLQLDTAAIERVSAEAAARRQGSPRPDEAASPPEAED